MKQFLALVMLAFSLSGNATQLELGLGQTQWSKPPVTQYWQNGFENSFDLLSPAMYAGVTDISSHKPQWFNAWSNGLRWRVGLLDLGTVKGQARATSDDSNVADYQCHEMSRCRPEDLSVWYTHGRTRGVEASFSPEWTVGEAKLGVKIGALAHLPSVKVRIWRDDRDPDRKEYDYKTRLNVGPTVGVNVSYKNATASLSCYKVNAGSNGEDDPTNDQNPVNIPQNWGSGLCDTVVLMGTWRF